MTAPRLLDLFCGAGGAAMGYAWAGFEVVGVDIAPQPRYPFTFIQADALEYFDGLGIWGLTDFDAIHASPPCQRYSAMSTARPGLALEYPDLIEPVRERLVATGLPYVIENVPGAPMLDPVVLCGQMFGLALYRHRLFESSTRLTAPVHPKHVTPASRAGHWEPGTIISVAGNFAPVAEGRRAMGIEWMNRSEMAESIPPAFTEHVGRQLMDAILEEAA